MRPREEPNSSSAQDGQPCALAALLEARLAHRARHINLTPSPPALRMDPDPSPPFWALVPRASEQTPTWRGSFPCLPNSSASARVLRQALLRSRAAKSGRAAATRRGDDLFCCRVGLPCPRRGATTLPTSAFAAPCVRRARVASWRLGGLGALGRKMLGVPIGLEIPADFGIDEENAGAALAHPGAHGRKIIQRAHRRRP